MTAAARRENRPAAQGGLPEALKAGIESLSGLPMDDVKVHYNSAQPAQLQALAYAQGTDIHVGPGQEQHLPHEAWHVVQQKQGRVQPTRQLKGTAVNDDSALEQEADVMGAKALTVQRKQPLAAAAGTASARAVVQRAQADCDYSYTNIAGATINQHRAGIAVMLGGVGGVNHSEQSAWGLARADIQARLTAGQRIDATFAVDTAICNGCRNWFETTVYANMTTWATTGGTTFTLTVDVNDKTVEVDGGNTIWTPEVADEHTFDRMPDMDRDMRFLHENRDEDGDVWPSRNVWVDDQVAILDELVATYQYNGLDHAAIEARMVQAKQTTLAMHNGRFGPDDENLTPAAWLADISFFNIIDSSRFPIHSLPEAATQPLQVAAWLNQIERDFHIHLGSILEDHFEDYPLQEPEYAYG
ncbi:DUF4157 domain-containing protein [Hymenobacter elongatus]|uniref:DUF4157 domain-containing protein n=2 Tax=Hymenobacter elongatus TaxID=877208 RepID=A0A4Z0PGZ0_9BACT|nr:DUF4157 domain-containing protein [Hymenobacter elongatus]